MLKLESELREVNKGINNLLDLIEAGRNSQAMADRLEQREQQKKLLEQNIAKEKSPPSDTDRGRSNFLFQQLYSGQH